MTPARSEPPRERSWSSAEVIVAYAILTVALTWPLVARFTTALPGDGSDAWLHYWHLAWMKRALLELHTSPYFTTDLHHPQGTTLLFQSMVPAPALIALPVVVGFGLAAGYNFLVVLSFVASGYGAYRLLLELLAADAHPAGADERRHLAAFLGGAVFAFSVYRFAHLLGHLDLLTTQWLPFFALHLVQSARRPGARAPILAALFLALTALSAWYYWLQLLVLAALFAAWHVRFERGGPRALARIVAGPALGCALLAPLLVAMTLNLSAGRLPDARTAMLAGSADLLGLFLPSPFHPLWGPALVPIWQRVGRSGGVAETAICLGFTALTLAATAVRRDSRRSRFWLLALAAFLVLSLGPFLHVGGKIASIGGWRLALPDRALLAAAAPAADVLRGASRFAATATLALAVLAGIGAARLLADARAPRSAFLALLALVLFESAAVPYPMSAIVQEPLWARIAADPRHAAVLEVPIPDDPGIYPRRMLDLTEHQKSVYGGYLSRGVPRFPFAKLPGFAALKELPAEPRGAADVVGDDPSLAALATLLRYDTGWIVVDRSLLSPESMRRARGAVAAALPNEPPFYEDERFVAWALPSVTALPRPVVVVGDGFGALEVAAPDAPSGTPARWRWMGETARFEIVAPHRVVRGLRIRAFAYRRPRRLALRLDGTVVGEVVVSPVSGLHETDPFLLDPGAHTIEIRSLDGAEVVAGRPLSAAVEEAALKEPPDALAASVSARLESVGSSPR
jgi:hypothetical protein